MSSNGNEGLAQRFAEPTIEHEFQLVVQQFCQVGTDSLREHAHTLKYWLLLSRILLPVRPVQIIFFVFSLTRITHPLDCNPALTCDMIDSRNGFISLPTAVATCPMAMNATERSLGFSS